MLSIQEIESKLEEIKPILSKRFNVNHIGYFGSYARGDFAADSDLDLLVEFSQPIGWGFFALEGFLEDFLGLKVDLVTESALKERIKDNILSQVKYI